MAQIHELIPKIMAEVKAVGKDHMNAQQGFKYRKMDDVINELHPILTRHQVFILPETLSETREERVTGTNKRVCYSFLKVRYTFYAPDGSSVAVTTVGEGMDSGDKATAKAQTSAFKYAVTQVFAIPTSDKKDPDEDTHDDVKPKAEPSAADETLKIPADAAPPKKWSAPAAPTREDPRAPKIDNLVVSFRKVGVSEKMLCSRYNIERTVDLTDDMIEDAKKVGRLLQGGTGKVIDYF